MRVSHKFHLIYFSIPKTGSRAVRSLLDPLSEEKIVSFPDVDVKTPFHSHMRPSEAHKVFREKGWTFDAYFQIATVRSPCRRRRQLAGPVGHVCATWSTRSSTLQRPDADGVCCPRGRRIVCTLI
jgi:hypothetical protein